MNGIWKYLTDKSPEYVADRAKKQAIIIYFLFLLIWFALAYQTYSENRSKLLTALLVLFGLFLFVLFITNVLRNRGWNQTVIQLGDNLYCKIIFNQQRAILKNKPLPIKTAFARLSYLVIFIALPFIFTILATNGEWSHSTNQIITSTRFNNENVFNKEITEGTIDVLPYLSNETAIKISYVVGNVFQIPVLNLCFLTNETLFDANKNNITHKISLSNKTYYIQDSNAKCFPIESAHQAIKYTWITEYQYPFNSNDLFLEVPKRKITIQPGENFFIVIALIVLAWMGTMHLIYHVYLDFKNIGSDKEGKLNEHP